MVKDGLTCVSLRACRSLIPSWTRTRLQVLVLRSGLAGKDEWSEQMVNLLEDYKKYFGESAPAAASLSAAARPGARR